MEITKYIYTPVPNRKQKKLIGTTFLYLSVSLAEIDFFYKEEKVYYYTSWSAILGVIRFSLFYWNVNEEMIFAGCK